jgi:dihydroorotase (multifunctional complex type)
MAAYELVVANGTLVTPRGETRADLGVRDGRIAAIGDLARETSGSEAAQTFDARGLYVLPGVIDEHVHFREPGLTEKEDIHSGSRAAVMGGVTTVLDMPNTLPPTDSAERVADKRERIRGRAYCDIGLFGLLSASSDVDELLDGGVVGLKCFLGPTTGDLPPPDDAAVLRGLRQAAARGARVGFHAEDDALVQAATRGVRESGRTDPLAHVDARPIEAEVTAIERVARLAARADAAVHVFHLSTADGLRVLEAWRRRGLDITCEVTPHHLFLTSTDMERIGPLARINPPLRPAGHAEALLEALREGRIDCVGTDHAPHTAAEKLRQSIWDVPSGFGGVEISVRLLLTLGGLSVSQLAAVTSEGPARVWGLAPRKGALEIGADADLTLVDLFRDGVIEPSMLHGKHNLTPFAGQRTRGAPVATVLRGEVIVRHGALLDPPRGEFLAALR